jgi:preprotein translocase subunit SecA
MQLNAYAQRDPLTEYQREGLFLFERMRETIKKTVVSNIFRVRLYTAAEIEVIKKRQEALLAAQMASHKQAEQLRRNAELRQDVKKLSTKIKRNDPCPCGSGKKYKHCHGA